MEGANVNWVRPTRVRYGVVGMTLLMVALSYLDRICISTAAPVIQSDLGISDQNMGFVFSAFTLAYAIFEVPSGWLADRFGARLALSRIVVWWSAMTAATGLATGFGSLIALRGLFGAGEAGAFPATARVYARWLPAAARGRVFGLAIMTGAIGGAITQPIVVGLLHLISWRWAFVIFGVLGLVWAGTWWTWFRDDPAQHGGVNAGEVALLEGSAPAPHGRVPWRALWQSRTLLALSGTHFGGIYGWYFFLTWLPTYLLRARGFDLSHAGILSALPMLGIAFGVLTGGWVGDISVRRFGRRIGRRLCGLSGLPLAAVAVVGAVETSDPSLSVYLFTAAAGLAAFGVPSAWSACVDIGAEHAGVVTGTMNTFGNLGGTLSPLVIAQCLERWGSWTASLLSVAVLYLFSAVCWLMVDAGTPLQVD